METTVEQVKQRISGFRDKVYETYGELLHPEFGKKYCRLMNGSSAWGFIQLSNGDILKAASFRKPAPTARGNIFAEDFGMSGVTQYGPKYLR